MAQRGDEALVMSLSVRLCLVITIVAFNQLSDVLERKRNAYFLYGKQRVGTGRLIRKKNHRGYDEKQQF